MTKILTAQEEMLLLQVRTQVRAPVEEAEVVDPFGQSPFVPTHIFAEVTVTLGKSQRVRIEELYLEAVVDGCITRQISHRDLEELPRWLEQYVWDLKARKWGSA